VPQTRNEKRCLAGEKSLQAHARATVDRAVRGQLGQVLGPGVAPDTSKAKKTLEKRIGKSIPQLQAIVERIQRVRHETAEGQCDEESNSEEELTTQEGPLVRETLSSALANSASGRGPLLAGAAAGAEAEGLPAAAEGLAGRVHTAAGGAAAAAAGGRVAAAAGGGGAAAARPGAAAATGGAATGGAAGSAQGRGRGPAGRAGGRGGRTALGRRIPASAQMQG
jgi:hypothetical protein